jgi:integrase
MWYIAYYAPVDGRSQEIKEAVGPIEKEAWKRLRARVREVLNARAGIEKFRGPRQEKVTVQEILTNLERDYAIHERRSLPQLRSHIKHVRKFFVFDRALSVTGARLREYIASRQRDGAAAATINRELEAIGRSFRLAIQSDLIAIAPHIPSLAERNARQGFFERAEFERVAAQLHDANLRDFVEWFFWTGMRPGEIRSLTWEGFDKETWSLRLHAKDAKTGYGRTIPLEGELRTVIERRIKARRLDSELIFHRAGRPIRDFRKRWLRACRAAGVAGRLLYDLRRTAVRNMVRAGVDPAIAMKISGHRTRAVFDRYNIVDERDVRDAFQRVTAYVDTLPATPTVVPIQKRKASS